MNDFDGIPRVKQSDVMPMLTRRLTHRAECSERPLILWHTDVRDDGIQWRLLHDTFRAFYEGRPIDERRGFLINPRTAKKERVGVVAIDAGQDYSATLEGFDDVPKVVYAPCAGRSEKVLADFPGAEEYLFEPDFEEWRGALPDKLDFLADFIESGARSEEDIKYRWYNRYGDLPGGCEMPGRWLTGVSRLGFLRYALRLKKLGELDAKSFRFDGISPDLVDEFHRYIIENNL